VGSKPERFPPGVVAAEPPEDVMECLAVGRLDDVLHAVDVDPEDDMAILDDLKAFLEHVAGAGIADRLGSQSDELHRSSPSGSGATEVIGIPSTQAMRNRDHRTYSPFGSRGTSKSSSMAEMSPRLQSPTCRNVFRARSKIPAR
jgi:hypothetical protein